MLRLDGLCRRSVVNLGIGDCREPTRQEVTREPLIDDRNIFSTKVASSRGPACVVDIPEPIARLDICVVVAAVESVVISNGLLHIGGHAARVQQV